MAVKVDQNRYQKKTVAGSQRPLNGLGRGGTWGCGGGKEKQSEKMQLPKAKRWKKKGGEERVKRGGETKYTKAPCGGGIWDSQKTLP